MRMESFWCSPPSLTTICDWAYLLRRVVRLHSSCDDHLTVGNVSLRWVHWWMQTTLPSSAHIRLRVYADLRPSTTLALGYSQTSTNLLVNIITLTWQTTGSRVPSWKVRQLEWKRASANTCRYRLYTLRFHRGREVRSQVRQSHHDSSGSVRSHLWVCSLTNYLFRSTIPR